MNQYYDDFIKIPSFLSSSLEKNINIPATLCDMQCQGQCVNGEGGCEQCGQSCSQSCGQSTTPTTVTCTKQVRLYNYNHTQLLDRYTAGSEELYPGYDFTPSAHQPAIPEGYKLYLIVMNGQDVTSGSVTCPSSDFTLIFNYVQDLVTVTCTKRQYLWNYNGTELIASSSDYEDFVVGAGFTPSAHQLPVPAGYSLYSITYNNKDVTTGTMTCPSSNFTLIFNYRKDEVSHLWINNGSQWVQVIPYINNGSKWVEYKAYLNNGSKWI